MTRLIFVLAALVLNACSTTSSNLAPGTVLDGQAKWALLPIANHTDTPQAALAAEAITEHLLRAQGINQLVRYPATLSRDSLLEPSERRIAEEAQTWAKSQGAVYGIGGAISEWRYKTGIDGEPAVSATLHIIDLRTNAVIWSASGAKAGWSRQAVSVIAHTLLDNLLSDLPALNSKP